MPDDAPYITSSPGEVISADNTNEVQILIKKDMTTRLTALAADIKQSGVDHAGDADQFGGKTPDAWTGDLDQRFAPRVHDHEGVTAYRRYLKRFTSAPGFDKILLPHRLGRYPLVDVYELAPVSANAPTPGCKLFFYYGNEDADTYQLYAVAYRDRVPLGLRFGPLLAELQVRYTDSTSLEDLLNDFWDAVAKDPNDRIPHCQSPWVDECCERHRTVADLRSSGQWDDLYVAIRPRKCAKGADLSVRGGVPASPTSQVEVTQADYDTLLIEVNRFDPDTGEKDGGGTVPLDLMILLRS